MSLLPLFFSLTMLFLKNKGRRERVQESVKEDKNGQNHKDNMINI